MIKSSDLTEIGSFFKPHGIKGELSCALDFGLEPDDLRCLVMDVDGIFVPFFISEYRPRGAESWLVRLDGVENESQAAMYANHTIYGLTAELPLEEDDTDGVYLYDLVGFEIISDGSSLGKIVRVDDSTANVLLIAESDSGNQIFVPFAEEFITALDPVTKKIEMTLPAGLAELNN